MTLTLVIDTSLAACCAGLFRDGVSVIEAVDPMDRGHAERIGVMVADLFREVAASPRDLGAIGVTLGPGSFTGLRVGLAFAKGMAGGLDLTLKGVGTLAALNAHPDLIGRKPLAVIHGGRGSLYVQYRDEAARTLAFPDLDAFAESHDIDVLTGPAVDLVKDHFRTTEVMPQTWPSLKALAGLIMTDGHDDLTPLYMRDADAIASTKGIITLGAAKEMAL